MLLRRFGGRRRLDLFFCLFLFWERQRALVACRRRMVSKKRGACFFFWGRLAFNWTWPSIGQLGIGKRIGNSRTAKVL